MSEFKKNLNCNVNYYFVSKEHFVEKSIFLINALISSYKFAAELFFEPHVFLIPHLLIIVHRNKFALMMRVFNSRGVDVNG